ncbi:siderophore-interacting protein [uncultured Jatrophihabitans sp.]|uniref:siderophore-interacting protein n=1 Tax=uncultured Jatrophihabitans sp. TaxID=1610747 RepID=UPI0035C9A2D0
MTQTASATARPTRSLPTPTTVHEATRLTPGLVRVVLRADDWSGFGEPQHADAYVKLVFLSPGVDYPLPLDPARIRDEFPNEHWPRMRTYTVRAFDRAAGTLTLDLIVHGDEGLAGPWAATAQPGDPMHVAGPGGGYSPDPAADWHLLAGDESALPAIANTLERLPHDAVGAAFVEVPDANHELALQAPDGVAVRWLHVGGGTPGSLLVPAVREWAAPAGEGHVFVHGEAGFVRDLRRHLRTERGLPLDRLSISGYWRLGADDERWRAMKRDWNRAVEADESGTT